MRWPRRCIAFIQAIIRRLSRRSGPYRIDVALELREARQLDDLALLAERQGLAGSARKLREAAARNRVCAAEMSRP